MKHILTLIMLVVIFTSCSTAYRAAQTPDDVYYSPTRERTEQYDTYARRDRYQENINYQDDRFLRMKVRNQNRWNQIDDFGYWYDSRFDYYNYNGFNNNFAFNNRFNNWYGFNTFQPAFGFSRFGNANCFSPNYYGFGGYYSPIYPVVYYRNPKVYSGVTGKSNLATYVNTRYNNSNTNFRKGDSRNDNFGNMVRRVFAPAPNAGSNSNSSFDRPARTTNSSAAPSSSAGGRSGGYNSTGSSSGSSRPPRN